jgi:sugar/nucleoside kinase (ribokinase family)
LSGYQNELHNFLKKAPDEQLEVVVMPDFFQDRIVNLDYNVQEFISAVDEIAKRKGGSVDGIAQADLRGGNAVNVASALASLGAKVTLIICTSKFGLQQIRFHLGQNPNIDISHVKIAQKASMTTALEFKTVNGKANVMLRDLGSLENFGPADLTDADWAHVENADYICLFNWAGTRKFGTQLAQTVFHYVKTKGKGKTYFDTADPSPNKEKILELMEKVLKTKQVDVLSLNENEAVSYASLLDMEMKKKREHMRFDELAMDAARILAEHWQARIDLHTTAFSATVTRKTEVVVSAFKVNALRATGAGDAWDAGNIVGDANALSAECRLALANAVAACYLSDPDGSHPTRQRLVKFLEGTK